MDIQKLKNSFESAFHTSKKQTQRLIAEILANINCFMNQLHHSIEGHKIRQKTISVMAPFLALMLFMCYIFVTAPYGLTEDGQKVEQPYVIKAGTIELAVVENSTVAQQVMSQFEKSFLSKGAVSISFDTEPFLNIDKKDLARASGPVTVLDQADAVAALMKSCQGANPLMTATLTEQLTHNKAIAHKVVKQKSDTLTVGTNKVKTKGSNGAIATTLSVTKVNGVVTGSKATQNTIVTKPVAEVILVGTKAVPRQTYSYSVSRSYVSTSSRAIAGTTGADVIAYARQFLGNPYVYGGTSLTNGTDCSGFTMSIYAHFGVYLPHSSYAQRSYGTPISYSEARPGDLIFYSGHVAIYMGGGRIIHASTPRTDITIGSATYGPIQAVRRIL
jgi:cell wall-associated NlpC family hydrolase